MTMAKKYLITTAIDYTNDVIHLGHSYQKVLADFLTRFHKSSGEEVFFMTGSDEHGGKVEESAKALNISPKKFVDEVVEKNKMEWLDLQIQYDRFMRTTDADHLEVVKSFWNKCLVNGDIYLGKFEGKYCVGCEEYKEEKDLVKGICPLHPKKQIETLLEENYFFKWSKYQNALKELYRLHPDFVKPEIAKNEMLAFLKNAVADIAISRPIAKLSWGIPVPNDDTQVIYVWFDALINYYTAGVGAGFWGDNAEIIHILGKDNLRWHALLWPAMLMSAGFDLPTHIYSHGFMSLDGAKISKSLGNVILPSSLISEFGSDAVRYYLLRYGPEVNDADVSIAKLKQVYESELANDYGNLVSRVFKMASKLELKIMNYDLRMSEDYVSLVNNYKVSEALALVMGWVRAVNEEINKIEPWKLSAEQASPYLQKWLLEIGKIAYHLAPCIPKSSEIILQKLEKNDFEVKPLFLKK